MKTLATTLFVAFGLICGTQNVSAAYTVPVTGKTATGVPVIGTFTIKQFKNINNAVNAVGTLTINSPALNRTATSVAMPVLLSNPPSAGAAAADPPSCPILHLVLGPLTLNVLGLQITLNQVILDITAIPGAGNLLGNLLCDIANLLNNPGSLLSTLIADLNLLIAGL